MVSRNMKQQKPLKILNFPQIKTPKTVTFFQTLVPKWYPNFLWRYQAIRADIRECHNIRGRKHSLLSPSCLPHKQGQTHLSTASESRSS